MSEAPSPPPELTDGAIPIDQMESFAFPDVEDGEDPTFLEEREKVSFTADSVNEFVEHGLGEDELREQSVRISDESFLYPDDEPSMLEDTPLGDLKIIFRTQSRNVMVWQIEEEGETQYLMTDESFRITEDGSFDGWWAPVESDAETVVSDTAGEFEGSGAFAIQHGAVQGELAYRGLEDSRTAIELVRPKSNIEHTREKEEADRQAAELKWKLDQAVDREQRMILNEARVEKAKIDERRNEERLEKVREGLRTPERIKNAVAKAEMWLNNIRNLNTTANGELASIVETAGIVDAEQLGEELRSNLDFRMSLRDAFRSRFEGMARKGEVYDGVISNKPSEQTHVRLPDVGANGVSESNLIPDKTWGETRIIKNPQYSADLPKMWGPWMCAEYALAMLDGSWNDERNVSDYESRPSQTTFAVAEDKLGSTLFQPTYNMHRSITSAVMFGSVMFFDREGQPIDWQNAPENV